MIRIQNVSVGSRLLPLSFQFDKGEIVHVIGPNGSGKSTLLEAMSGVVGTSSTVKGQVFIDEHEVSKMSLIDLALHRAYLSQSARPSFNLEVFHYLSLSVPSCVKGDWQRVNLVLDELCELLQIREKLHRSIQQLSGGEWQRVRLAAMCLQIWPTLNPYAKLMILDEPAAPLDIGQEALLYQLIDKITDLGISVVMANHDLNRTLRHAHKVLLLDKGVMESFGSTNEVLKAEKLSAVFKTEVKRIEVEKQPHLIFG